MTLTTLARVTELIPNFNSADSAVMTDILQACSDFIEKYCNRTFAVTTYDELYDGTGDLDLLLNNYPIVYVDRVMYNPINVLQIRMTDQAASRGTFRLDSTNLYLTKVINGVSTTHTLTLSSYNMLSDLQNAINAFSSEGWNALALGVYATFPVTDIYTPQGGFDCRWQGAGYLKLHAYSLPDFKQRAETGEIVSPFGFPRGYQQYRVIYQAGFPTVPTPIQQACAELAAAVYQARGQNANLQSESLGGYSYTRDINACLSHLSVTSKEALALYMNRRVPKFVVI